MDTNNKQFPQQDAPAKNTDNAFVQVGKDGEPVMPHAADDKNGDREAANQQAGDDREL